MTAEDPAGRPSRRGWPLRTEATTTPAGTHAHALPRWVPIALIGLTLTMLMLIGVVALIVHRNQQLTAFRNEQQAENREEMRQGFCDLLDQFPQSALLDGPRRRYGCGPGIPLDELPPAIRQQWTPPMVVVPAPSSAAPTTTTPAPDRTEGATAPSREVPAPVPPRPTEAPPVPTAPPTPVDPVLCQLLKICVEVH